MRTSDVCKSYFNGFHELSSLRKNTCIENCAAILKILSYATVIIPLTFAIVHGISSLRGRIKKQNEASENDLKIKNKSIEVLGNSKLPKDNEVIKTKEEEIIPEIEEPQLSEAEVKIKKLIVDAEAEVITSSKVKAFCKIAKQQVDEKQIKEASCTLDRALKAIPSDEAHREISSFCEIAKMRLMISPGKVPEELDQGLSHEESERYRIPNRSRHHLLPLHAGKLCLLAKGYHQAGNTDKAKELIVEATSCAYSNKARTIEYLGNLMRIAEMQILVGLIDEAVETLKTMLEEVQSLGECAPEVSFYTKIALLMISLKSKTNAKVAMSQAKEAISKAEQAFRPYASKSSSDYSWHSGTKKMIEDAKEALKNAN